VAASRAALPCGGDLSEFIQSIPSSFLARSLSFPAAIYLAIVPSVLIDVACLDTAACENQPIVVSDLQF
jgi:hypothetical protein